MVARRAWAKGSRFMRLPTYFAQRYGYRPAITGQLYSISGKKVLGHAYTQVYSRF